jgi:hypothetical protein
VVSSNKEEVADIPRRQTTSQFMACLMATIQRITQNKVGTDTTTKSKTSRKEIGSVRVQHTIILSARTVSAATSRRLKLTSSPSRRLVSSTPVKAILSLATGLV